MCVLKQTVDVSDAEKNSLRKHWLTLRTFWDFGLRGTGRARKVPGLRSYPR